ncbi:MAG: flavodoxin [Candidatus Dactylopiibacterium sp.]|nr:flavodoxin [Candidatus Dactylopiibacterium sp.]
MPHDHDPQRRALAAFLATLPALPALASPGDTLVAYFSRTGHTRVIAGLLQRALGATLFEIRAASPYPDDYLATVERARRESAAGTEPGLAARMDVTPFRHVLLGFPVWGMTTPAPIRSFLRQHALAGRTLTPFITHGGHGTGDCLTVLARHAPGATLRPAFVMEAEQERRVMERVNAWLARAAG